MIKRYRIKSGSETVRDLREREAFKLDGTDYPADWLFRKGKIPNHTIEPYDATPPPPPPREPTATGAQMIDEAKSRNKLDALLTALTASERATLYTRRRIIAGSPFSEVLRAKLNLPAPAMAAFIATAAMRGED